MLVESLIGSKKIFAHNLTHFAKHPEVGMIDSKYLVTSSDDTYTKELVHNTIKKLGFNIPQKITFVAGTMFIARTHLFLPIIKSGYTLNDFEPTGKSSQDNTLAHAFERVFGAIITEQQLSIYLSNKGYLRIKIKNIFNRMKSSIIYIKKEDRKTKIKLFGRTVIRYSTNTACYSLIKQNYGVYPINTNYDYSKKIAKYIAFFLHPLNKQKRKNTRKALNLHKKKFLPSQDFDANRIPIYIISFNRLSYLQQMIAWLEQYGLTNIHIIDNASTYPPLLEFLSKTPYTVHYMNKNWGHRVFWVSGAFDDIIKKSMYIVSDPDIAPNKNLPKDFLYHLYRILGTYKNITKVGFALDITNLPPTDIKEKVIKWETKFWVNKLPDPLELYKADIDTTFALYRPGIIKMNTQTFYCAIRVGGNFSAIHIPWYKNTPPTEEDIFYKRHASSESATWTKRLSLYEERK